MTDEQRAAHESLKVAAAPLRLRVTLDSEEWPRINGSTGQIEHNGGTLFAVYTNKPRMFAKLWAIPGVRRWQTGDDEMRALFPFTVLPAVAAVVRARVRRTSSTAKHLAAHAYKAVSGA